jgi:hypothetical protein
MITGKSGQMTEEERTSFSEGFYRKEKCRLIKFNILT